MTTERALWIIEMSNNIASRGFGIGPRTKELLDEALRYLEESEPEKDQKGEEIQ